MNKKLILISTLLSIFFLIFFVYSLILINKQEDRKFEDEKGVQTVEGNNNTQKIQNANESNNLISSESSTLTIKKIPSVCLYNCNYYPLNKTLALSNGYVPDLVKIKSFQNFQLTPTTADYFEDFLSDAKNKGIKVKVISAYRSFDTQNQTFNNWVSKEKAKGLSTKDAIDKANTYSAKPGHSEHQLGTTLDIACLDCKPFSNEYGNIQLYNFIKTEGYKYGFILSYTDKTTHLTGYKYEPWHIRNVGINLAKKLFEQDYLNSDSIYLEKFLLENYFNSDISFEENIN